MELDENKIKEIERLKLLFHLPEFWVKEYLITDMETRRAIGEPLSDILISSFSAVLVWGVAVIIPDE